MWMKSGKTSGGRGVEIVETNGNGTGGKVRGREQCVDNEKGKISPPGEKAEATV